MRKKSEIIKRVLSFLLIFLLSINSFSANVNDNDGAAFITKAEFDSLKNNFQNQLDTYNQSIDSKIDNAIASYLSGIKITKEYTRTLLCSNLDSVECLYLPNNDENIFHYEWAPVGLTLRDHSAYLNFPQNTAGWTIMISASLSHAPEEMHKILIKNLDKSNKWALWAGYTENATEDWMGENYWFSNNHKTGLLLTEVPSFDGWVGMANSTQTFYFEPVNGRPSRNNEIAYTSLRFTGNTTQWKNGYRYTSIIKNDGEIKHKNAIIFKAAAEDRFTPQDEVLGFANAWPRGDNVRMKVNEIVGTIDAQIYCTLPPGDVYKNQNTSYSGAPTNGDVEQFWSITYDKYYPGEKWANSYITNWNQLYTDAYGATWGPHGDSYLALSAGLPFLKVSKNEIVKYDIAFADPTEKYDLYAKTTPFTDEGVTYISSPDEIVKLSVDGETYYDSLWIQGGATIYMDFKDKNIIDSDKIVYLKWTKSGETDGGGELIIKDHTTAEITLKD